MAEEYQWYVLYVRTNAEKRVIYDIDRFVRSHDFGYRVDPFCPESEYYYRNKKDRQAGHCYKKRPLFSGYVFIETDMPPKEFLGLFGAYIYGSTDIVRILKQGDSAEGIALPSSERQRLEYMLKGKRCLERSVGFIVGDVVHIECGPLKGHEGEIKYINRHNRYADIEVDMFGGKARARVALEIVNKTE